MQALAKQILAAAPTLVSLQELDQWYSGPFGLGTQTWRHYDWDRPMLARQVTKITYRFDPIERWARITVRQGEFGSPEHAGGRGNFYRQHTFDGAGP